ncbi:hypothetical protein CCACVL1_08246, partial [Corchorus capsularis]
MTRKKRESPFKNCGPSPQRSETANGRFCTCFNSNPRFEQ